jgi:hypothetical protein
VPNIVVERGRDASGPIADASAAVMGRTRLGAVSGRRSGVSPLAAAGVFLDSKCAG